MSSELAQTIGKVPTLTGQTNYRVWALEIKAAARFATIWKTIQGTDTATSSERSDIVALEAREEKAIGLITKTVSSTLKVELDDLQVTDTTSAKSFWRLIGYRRVPSGTVAYQLETADTAVRFLPFDRTTVLVIAMRCGVTVTVVT